MALAVAAPDLGTIGVAGYHVQMAVAVNVAQKQPGRESGFGQAI